MVLKTVFEFIKRFWFLVLVVAAIAGVAGAVAAQSLPMWPFVVVLLGIFARTLLGLANAALTLAKESGEWPVFEKRYYVSLIASIALDLLAMAAYFAMTEGALIEISALAFTFAFMFGYGGSAFIRDVQKAAQNVRAVA